MAACGLDWPDLFDTDISSSPDPLVEYVYKRPDGEQHMVVGRWPNKQFRQRLPGRDYRGGLGGLQPCLYRLDKVVPHAEQHGDIWIAEGEKDVHALERLGLVATTNPGGAGKWRSYYWTWLDGARSITIVADRDQHQAGMNHARAIVADLEERGFACRIVQAKSGKDAYDHVAQGYGVEDFVPVARDSRLPVGMLDAPTLAAKEFPPLRWIIKDVLCNGLAMLGGPPKLGKSYLAQDLALAVALGGNAWGHVPVQQGAVLYLALDNDSERRLRDRQDYLMGNKPMPDGTPLYYATDWPTGDEAIAAVQEWCREVEEPLLVVVDTVGRVEPEFTSDRDGYRTSTGIAQKWHAMAEKNGVCVMFIHHDRKQAVDKEDWINRFLGSRGITASISTLMFLDTQRGKDEAYLRLTGRDTDSDDIELRRVGRSWQAFDPVGV
jgi:hypothetical protein